MQQLAQVHHFSTRMTGYGHWLITLIVDNPALFLSEDDHYWRFNDKEDEPDQITLKHTTTNSRAIDGHDGYKRALANECIRANEWDEAMFDLSILADSDE